MNSFNSISHDLIDAWVRARSIDRAEELYANVLNRLSVKMALSLVTTNADNPYDWHFQSIKSYAIKTTLLDWLKLFPEAHLRDLDRSYVDEMIIPTYSKIIELQRPMIDMVRGKIAGTRIGYDRLTLPQKCEGKPGWCISLTDCRFILADVKEEKMDATDDSIVQLLIEGSTAKEIAQFLNLSHRTIEHRIDRMKTRLNARNLVHLVAKLVAVHVDNRSLTF